MYDLVYGQFEQFAYLSGIIGYVRENVDVISWTMVAVGIVLCAFGIYAYRYIAALITFFLVAEGIIFLGAGRTSWGTVVTAFAVTGVFLAYYIWNANYWSAIILCLASIALHFANATDAWEIVGYIVLMAGCIFAIAIFPVESICGSTAIIGTLLLKDLFDSNYRFMWIIVAVLGIALQLLLSKKQSLFDKRYPDWLTARIKKKDK